MITEKVRLEVFQRSNGYCACGCGRQIFYDKGYPHPKGREAHHGYHKSEYKYDDRDLARNVFALHRLCHKSIHNGNHELDKTLKEKSDLLLPKDQRSSVKVKSTIKIKVQSAPMPKYDKVKAREQRKRNEDYFKSKHDGLSPSQFAYKQKKQYLKKLEENQF